MYSRMFQKTKDYVESGENVMSKDHNWHMGKIGVTLISSSVSLFSI